MGGASQRKQSPAGCPLQQWHLRLLTPATWTDNPMEASSIDRRRSRRCSLPLLPLGLQLGQSGTTGPLARPVTHTWRHQQPRYSICSTESLLRVPSPQNRKRSPSRTPTKRVGLELGHHSPPVSTVHSSFFDDSPLDSGRRMSCSFSVSFVSSFPLRAALLIAAFLIRLIPGKLSALRPNEIRRGSEYF